MTAEGSHDADRATGTATWDPYDVWLKRVKQPRDETRRLRKVDRDAALAAPDAGGETDADAPPRPSPA